MNARELLRGAGLAFALRVAGAGLGLALNWWLAHHMGAERLGLFFLAMTVVSLVAILGRLGLENTVLRMVSAAAAAQDWMRAKQLGRDAVLLALLASAVLVLALFLLAPALSVHVFHKPDLVQALHWLAPTILAMAAIILYGEMLKAVKHISESQVVQSLTTPVLALAVFIPLGALDLQTVVITYAAAMFAAALLGWRFWRRALPRLAGPPLAADYRGLLAPSTAFIWINVMSTLNDWADILALGVVAPAEEVGVYGLTKRLVLAMSFVLIAVNIVVAPRFAALHDQNDLAALRRTALHATRLTALVAGPFVLALLLFHGWILGLFGPDFQAGGLALAIMAGGQLVNLGTGSVGQLLAMTGQQERLRKIAFIVTGANILLLLILVPQWGMLGAAAATGFTIALDNLLKTYFVIKQFGFRVDFFSAWGIRNQHPVVP